MWHSRVFTKVQRLCGSGRELVRGHGSAEEFLRADRILSSRELKIAGFWHACCLRPPTPRARIPGASEPILSSAWSRGTTVENSVEASACTVDFARSGKNIRDLRARRCLRSRKSRESLFSTSAGSGSAVPVRQGCWPERSRWRPRRGLNSAQVERVPIIVRRPRQGLREARTPEESACAIPGQFP
jgi:hypothetical protein